MPNLTVNGVTFNYPSTGSSNWGTDATGWAAAITSGTLQKAGGNFSLTADANFGANFGLLSKYFTSRSTSPASAGVLRLANTDLINWRNAANSADKTLGVDSSDQLAYAGTSFLSSAGVLLAAGFPTLTGDVTTPGNSLATTIAANAVTYAKLQQVAASSLVGNATGSLANATGITLGATLAFSGSALQTAALTGDVTASANSFATTLASSISGAKTFSTSLTSPAFISSSSNPASAGVVRLASTDAIKFRNNANGADVALAKDTSDQLSWAGTSFLSASGVLLAAAHPALTGDVTNSAGSLAMTLASSISGAKTFSTSLTSPAFISSTANPAAAGIHRLANTDNISWRNAANNADKALTVSASDQLSYAGTSFLSSAGVLLAAGFPALTGDVTTSAGSLATSIAATSNATLTTLSALTTASALVTVGTIATGTWSATAIGATKGGTAQTTWTTGDILYASGTNTLSKLGIGTFNQALVTNASGVPTWQTLQQGAKNYITYNNFENNATTGWSLAHSAISSNVPTTVASAGTSFSSTGGSHGGSAATNCTLAATNTNPLAGTISLTNTIAAASTAGDMVISDAITIDAEDQAKVLAFKFYYKPTSNPSNANWSGTSSNSFSVWIYDVTNAAWIQPAGTYNLVQSTGVGISQGTFQTPSNMTQFQIAIVNNAATSGAITMMFDDFYVGPQALAFGPPMTDWTAFTPTGTWSTNTTYVGYYRRHGDSVDIQYQISLAGAPTSATLILNLPTGMTIDTTKLPATRTYMQMGQTAGQAAAHGWIGSVQYNNTTSVQPTYLLDGSTASIQNAGSITQATPYTFANGDLINVIVYDVPIVGWSTSTVMSADTDTRVVSMRYGGTSSTISNTAAIVKMATLAHDTHSAYNTSTGNYTVPVSGYYHVDASLITDAASTAAGGSASVYVYKNGVEVLRGVEEAYSTTNNDHIPHVHGTIQCVAGDTLAVWGSSSFNTPTIANATDMTYVSIDRLSGPAVVAATENVNARYTTADSQTITTATFTVINFTVKEYDSHGAVTTGASWKFTAPVAGKYRVSSTIGFTGFTPVTTHQVILSVFKNGSEYARVTGAGISEANVEVGGSATVLMAAGDYLDIRGYQDSGGSINLNTGSALNFMSVEKVG